jgi:hypothetical protein
MRPSLLLGLLCWSVAGVSAGEPETYEWTVRLTLPPAREQAPALKFALLPETRQQTPGNAALLYYRAFSPEWLTHRQPDFRKQFNDWLDNPKQKPKSELRWVLNYRPLDEVARAARRSYCDWEMTERLRKDGIGMLLPDVQSMREFGSLLSLRARIEMEAGEHEKVHQTLQTGFALSRHVAEGPTLIQSLVGIAIQAIMMRELENWLETPGAPNLYWPLSNLPTPYVDLRKPLQGEKIIIESLFPGVREALIEHKPPAVPLQTMLNALTFVNDSRPGPSDEMSSLPQRVGMAVYAAKVYPEARKSLRVQGWKEKDIETMSITQAALLFEVFNYDRVYDDLIKWYGLPFWQARAGMQKVQKTLRPGGVDENIGLVLARLLVPATDKVMVAGVRTDRRIAALRCIEAMRMYAADKGQWPEKLDDITEVPIPPDPFTGKQFRYAVKGNQAILSGPPPTGEQAHQGNAISYQITLKK